MPTQIPNSQKPSYLPQIETFNNRMEQMYRDDTIGVCGLCGQEFPKYHKSTKYCQNCRTKGGSPRARKPHSITWNSLKEYVNERDDYKCQKCGNDKEIVVHHIHLLCKGGANAPENLITLCRKCHLKSHKYKEIE